MITYLIIDDEHIAHDIIKGYCDLLPNMKLIKSCYDGLEAFEYLSNNEVDLISRRSQRMIEAARSPNATFPDDIKSEITELRDLLGRLWNQKTFYRPTDRFVGGG